MRLEEVPGGPIDAEHMPLAAFLQQTFVSEPALDAMVMDGLGRVLAFAPPLSPDQIPLAFVESLPELARLQSEANHCLRVVCMKVALVLSLVYNAPLSVRESVSSEMATLVEASQEIDEDALGAFLRAQFDRHGICSPPITRFIAQSDFLRAFGYTDVFRSTIAKYAADLGLRALREPSLPEEELISAVFPCREECVGREVLHRLSAIGGRLAAIVSAHLPALREEYEALLLAE
jgi:hypothetical protein